MVKRCACRTPRVEIRKGKFWCLDCGGKVSAGNKYGAERTPCGQHTHDSKREAERCGELQLMEKAGEICSLEFQPRYELTVAGVKICTYVADFRYHERYIPPKREGHYIVTWNEDLVIEDVKGKRTREFIIKRKLMKACFGIEVLETT
jgi:hypothetical protein